VRAHGRRVVWDFQTEKQITRIGPAPNGVKHWSMTTLREKLIKIGAKVVSSARYVVFQMAEVAIPRGVFRAILHRIRQLRLPGAVSG
jgi:hypothetical protein